MFEGIWGKLDLKTGFQSQSVTKNMRLTLIYLFIYLLIAF